jgi:hypothetical protein
MYIRAMKNLLLTILLVSFSQLGFSQTEWSEWATTGYDGINYRVGFQTEERTMDANKKWTTIYYWNIQFSNSFSSDVAIEWALGDYLCESQADVFDQRTQCIKANSIQGGYNAGTRFREMEKLRLFVWNPHQSSCW